MKMPLIDPRTKKDIIEYIRIMAPFYCPTWKFDTENPDVGSALMLILSELFEETINRLNRLPYKNYIEFLNLINISLQSTIPAEGYVTFGITNGITKGEYLPKGSQLFGDSSSGQRVIFETTDDVFVTPAQIHNIFTVDAKNDGIYHVFENQATKDELNIKVFSSSDCQNIQKHEFYICSDDVLTINSEAEIGIKFINSLRPGDVNNFVKSLSDCNNATWEYLTNSGWEKFFDMKICKSEVVLNKKDDKSFLLSEIEGHTSNWIRCRVNNMEALSNMTVTDINIKAKSENIQQFVVFSNDMQMFEKGFYIFGERFSLYNNFLILCDEVFSKRGAHIALEFKLKLDKVNIERLYPDQEIDWKLIMKRSNFREPVEYEISIGRVVWEYWNSKGWTRLCVPEEYEKIFDGNLQGKIVLNFKCPEDIQKVTNNSFEGIYLRARIVTINNPYSTRGNYISPFISDIKLSYDYKEENKPIDGVISYNNTYMQKFLGGFGKDDLLIELIKGLDEINPCMYMGFDFPLENQLTRILFTVKKEYKFRMPELEWYAYTRHGSKLKWEKINITDETHGLQKNGIVTILNDNKFEKINFFGKECYWIRIMNIDRSYDLMGENEAGIPCITGIYLNSTTVKNIQKTPVEFFFIQVQEQNKICQLYNKKVVEQVVWVNEFGVLGDMEIDELSKEKNKCNIIKDENGDIKEIWVKWDEIEDFTISKNTDRHYKIDKFEGIITFGDGIHGKIPPAKSTESIKVEYSIGGGEAGNLNVGEVSNLTRNIGFINKVYNPQKLNGGCDREGLSSALSRGASILHHNNRLVTVQDYEAVAMETSRNIVKAKCFSNVNEFGEKEAGHISIVVLEKEYAVNREGFQRIKDQIKENIENKVSDIILKTGKLNVVDPVFVAISIKADILVEKNKDILWIKKEISDRVERFFDPVTGNFNALGWNIGEMPGRMVIYDYLKMIEGVKYIKQIMITASWEDINSYKEVDYESFPGHFFAIPVNGKHDFKVSKYQ